LPSQEIATVIRAYGDANQILLVNEDEEEVVDFETGNIPYQDIDPDDDIIVATPSNPETNSAQTILRQRLMEGLLTHVPSRNLLPLIDAKFHIKESYQTKKKIYLPIIQRLKLCQSDMEYLSIPEIAKRTSIPKRTLYNWQHNLNKDPNWLPNRQQSRPNRRIFNDEQE
jgi:hypothetical protein